MDNEVDNPLEAGVNPDEMDETNGDEPVLVSKPTSPSAASAAGDDEAAAETNTIAPTEDPEPATEDEGETKGDDAEAKPNEEGGKTLEMPAEAEDKDMEAEEPQPESKGKPVEAEDEATRPVPEAEQTAAMEEDKAEEPAKSKPAPAPASPVAKPKAEAKKEAASPAKPKAEAKKEAASPAKPKAEAKKEAASPAKPKPKAEAKKEATSPAKPKPKAEAKKAAPKAEEAPKTTPKKAAPKVEDEKKAAPKKGEEGKKPAPKAEQAKKPAPKKEEEPKKAPVETQRKLNFKGLADKLESQVSDTPAASAADDEPSGKDQDGDSEMKSAPPPAKAKAPAPKSVSGEDSKNKTSSNGNKPAPKKPALKQPYAVYDAATGKQIKAKTAAEVKQMEIDAEEEKKAEQKYLQKQLKNGTIGQEDLETAAALEQEEADGEDEWKPAAEDDGNDSSESSESEEEEEDEEDGGKKKKKKAKEGKKKKKGKMSKQETIESLQAQLEAAKANLLVSGTRSRAKPAPFMLTEIKETKPKVLPNGQIYPGRKYVQREGQYAPDETVEKMLAEEQEDEKEEQPKAEAGTEAEAEAQPEAAAKGTFSFVEDLANGDHNQPPEDVANDDDAVIAPQTQPKKAAPKKEAKSKDGAQPMDTSNGEHGGTGVDDRFLKEKMIRQGTTLWEIVVPGLPIVGQPYNSKAEWQTVTQENIFRCRRVNKKDQQMVWKFMVIFLSDDEEKTATPTALTLPICGHIYPGLTKIEASNRMSWKKIRENNNEEEIDGEKVPMVPQEYYVKCGSGSIHPADVKRGGGSKAAKDATAAPKKNAAPKKKAAAATTSGKGKRKTPEVPDAPTEPASKKQRDAAEWAYIGKIYKALQDGYKDEFKAKFPIVFSEPNKRNAHFTDDVYLEMASNPENKTLKFGALREKYGETQCDHMFAVVNRIAKFWVPPPPPPKPKKEASDDDVLGL